MTVEFELTAADLEALRLKLESTWNLKRTYRKIYSTALGVGFTPLGIIAAMMITGGAPAASYLLLVPPAAVFIGLWTFFYKLLVLPAMISDFGNANAHIVGHHAFVVTESGVRGVRPFGESFHKWSAVESIHDDADHIFIGVIGRGYYTVPKRSLCGAAEVDALLAEMNRHRTATQASRPPDRLSTGPIHRAEDGGAE